MQVVGVSGVAAEQSVIFEQPEIARDCNGIGVMFRQLAEFIKRILVRFARVQTDNMVNFLWLEPRDGQIGPVIKLPDKFKFQLLLVCQSQSKKGPDRGVKRGHCV